MDYSFLLEKKKMIITNKFFDLHFIKFPILFPIIFAFFLYTFPSYENILIFLTLLILAEPHFGATIPFFLDGVNRAKILEEKIKFILAPILIIIYSIVGFFYFYDFFLLSFLAANFYHVTKQSYGICKLFNKDKNELSVQEFFIYSFNIIFFFIALNRFSFDFFSEYNLELNYTIVILLLLISILYIKKFGFSENYLSMMTGIIIFFPVCFVTKPIHAIVMGVTMHYSQYLVLTYKIVKNRYIERNYSNPGMNFIILISAYGLIMTSASTFAILNDDIFKYLLIVPLVGQMLHFYIDSNLWKFSDSHHRDVTLRHLVK